MGKQKLITVYNMAMQIQVRKLFSLIDSQFLKNFNQNLISTFNSYT